MANWEFEVVDGPYGSPTDGPAWDGTALLFTHLVVPANTINNRILRYDPETGDVTDFRRWTNRVVGLAFSSSGILYGCQSGSRRVVRFNDDGSTTPMAHQVDGKYHNQAKDLVIDRQGRIWFADPVWGPPVQGGLRAYELEPLSISHRSVLRIETPQRDSPITRVTHDTNTPVSVLLSPDENTLYVSECGEDEQGKRELRAYPVLPNGTVGPYTLLHTFGSDYKGVHRGITGMCLDADGNIVACAGWERSGAGPMVYVFSPQGRILETQPVPAEPTNCTFGGAGLDTLYLTTSEGHLYRVRNTGRKGWSIYP